MLTHKRALPYDRGEFYRPAKKRSFVGRGRGSSKTNVISMSSEYLSKIMTELKQGLYHIGEALNHAEEAGSDMFCMQPISDAQEFIQRFVRTTVAMPRRSNDKWNVGQPNAGWNPMRSQFLGINGFLDCRSERGRGRGRRRGRGRARGRGRGRGGLRGRYNGYVHKAIGMNKPTRKAVTKYCDICKLKCNSLSQWTQHINGYTHKARLAGEDPPKRTKKTDLGKKTSDSREKTPRKLNAIPQRSPGEVPYKQYSGRQIKKTAFDRRRLNGKRQPTVWLTCKLCNTKCNGKVQYAGHMNGKQHQMALERREKEQSTKIEGEIEVF